MNIKGLGCRIWVDKKGKKIRTFAEGRFPCMGWNEPEEGDVFPGKRRKKSSVAESTHIGLRAIDL